MGPRFDIDDMEKRTFFSLPGLQFRQLCGPVVIWTALSLVLLLNRICLICYHTYFGTWFAKNHSSRTSHKCVSAGVRKLTWLYKQTKRHRHEETAILRRLGRLC